MTRDRGVIRDQQAGRDKRETLVKRDEMVSSKLVSLLCSALKSNDFFFLWVNGCICCCVLGPVGLKGQPGDAGRAGNPGPGGPRGLKGANGAVGEPGPMGQKGPVGELGPSGRPGVAGTASYVYFELLVLFLIKFLILS